ncbi:MAG: nucleoside monophosphate kinase, partial [Candidatus Firestonebacteria bacterium]
LDLVVNLNVSDALILKRLTNRRVCRKCGAIFNLFSQPSKKGEKVCDVCDGELYQRADDTEATIKNRLAVYARDTEPLIEYYRATGLLRDVNAEIGISDIMTSMKKVLKDNNIA